MKAYQFFAIFLVFNHIPSYLGKNIPDMRAIEQRIRNNTSPQKPKLVYAFDQLSLLGSEYIASSAEICRNILKDEALSANADLEVIAFKNDLKNFLDKYDDNSNKDAQNVWDLVESYGKITLRYLIMPEEQKTPGAKFILEILKQYGCENNNNVFLKKFHVFADNFTKKFEDSSEYTDKMWLIVFKSLTKFQDRIGAIIIYLTDMS